VAYTVLARKYRSGTFGDVIGQEPIATTLANAIKAGRVHHGYLFTGTRGVGKTSMARILAKALNCLSTDAPTATPCGECDACRAIAEGNDVDVIEIDAASNTGVDNIRELRSNAAYRPARARFKVYIIDEVHMLSTGAFNALLKTLEEPPEHVKFVLATTELQKVPATIQSRCQCFRFRHIGPEAIAKRLAQIIAAEGAQADDVVVQRIARLAAGSMRDALSILDQLLSVAPERLDAAVLDELLPPAQDEEVFRLLERAAEGDAAGVLTVLDGILSGGRGLEVFCNDAIEVVRALMLVRTCGPDVSLVDLPAGTADAYVALSQRFELSHYIQMIAMLEELRRNVRFSGAGRALTEALMVRFAHMPQWTAIEHLLRQLPAGGGAADEKKKSPVNAPARPAEPAAQPPAEPTMARRTPLVLPPRPVPVEPDTIAVDESGAQVPDDYRPVEDTGETPVPHNGPVPHDGPVPHSRPVPPGGAYPPVEDTGETPVPHRGVTASATRPSSDVTAEQRRQIEDDPLVRQTMELFDGIVMRVTKQDSASGEPIAE
jgi:DNA polymerase-3 subunit gamma/tau